MVKAVKALNSSASEGQENNSIAKKKNQSSPSSSSSNFTSPKCTLVLNTALQNFSVYKTTYINQGEKKDGTTKKKINKRGMHFSHRN